MAFTVSPDITGHQATNLGHSGLTPIASNKGDAGWVGDDWTQQWFPRLYTTSAFDSGGDAERLARMSQIKTLFDQYKSGSLDRAGYQEGVQQFPWVNRLQWITGNWFNPTQNPPAQTPGTGGGGGTGTTPPPPTSPGGAAPPPSGGPPAQSNPQGGWTQASMSQLPGGLASRLPQIGVQQTYANERPESYGPSQSWLERLLSHKDPASQTAPSYQIAKQKWE